MREHGRFLIADVRETVNGEKAPARSPSLPVNLTGCRFPSFEESKLVGIASTSLSMVAEKVLITFAYDAWKGLFGSFLRDRDHEKAVNNAASTVASDVDGISVDDLRDIFEAELDEDVLNSAGASEIESDLARALKIRANTPEEVDYEAVITRFLDELEQTIVAQGRPEEGVQVLYEYAQKTNNLAEALRDEIRRLHREYYDDFTTLSNRSNRVVPDEDQYHLPGIDKHIHQPATSAIQRSISDGENVILTGPAGVGKSGILAELYHTWEEEQAIYFLDAREFGGIRSRRDIESELGLQNGIRDVFSRITDNSSGCVLLVDQLDNIRTERDVPNIFQHLLLDLAKINNITVVCACRDWDLNKQDYQQLRDADNFSQIAVEPLSEKQIERTFTELGIKEAVQNDDLLELCQSLLNLSLLADIVAQNGDVDASTITEKITLWEKYRVSLNSEGSEAHGKIPRDWDESPVDRAVGHARSSLQKGKASFRIDRRKPGDKRLLSRRTINEDAPEKGSFRHDQLQAYFYAFDAQRDNLDIQEILEDGLDELIAADVFEWMLQFYLDNPSRGTSFIRDALGSSSDLGFYARTIIAETAGSLGPETLGEDVARAVVESLNTDSKLAREFYRELESPDWADFLIEQELLSETGFHAAQYIARLAEVHPQIFVAVMKSYDSVEIQIVQTYLSALENLEGDQLASTAQTIEAWIHNFENEKIHLVERDLTKLISTLLEDSQPETATELVSLLVEPVEIEVEEQEIGEYSRTKTTIESRFEPYTLQNFFEEHTEELAETCGMEILDHLETHFRDCLGRLCENSEADIPPEQALTRRTASPSYQVRDLEIILYQSVEDTLTHLVSTGSAESKDKVEEYIHEGGIFTQIGIHALGKNPEQATGLVTELLTNWSEYEEDTSEDDYIYLLKNGFEYLPDSDKQEVLERIEEGPDEQQIRESLRSYSDVESEEAIEESVETQVEGWKLKRYYHIQQELSNSKQDYVQELIDRHGELEYDPVSGYRLPYPSEREIEEEEKSPSFADMDVDDFIESCIELSTSEPSNEQEAIPTGPRPELGRELEERIRSEPTMYLPQLPALVEAGDELFVDTAFSAIESLILNVNHQDTSIENWDAVITAASAFCSSSPVEERWSQDCRRTFADMIRAIISHARSTLQVENYANELSEILLTLLEDVDVGTEHQSVEGTLSIRKGLSMNGVRATGVVATIYHLSKLERESHEIPSEQQIWDRLQELVTDSAESVRVGFGKMFPTIHALDEDFISSNLHEFLPETTDDDTVSRFVSVWNGIMMSKGMSGDLFGLLKPKYEHATKLYENFDIPPHDQTFENTCSHLAIAYARSYLSYSDDLLQSVFAVSTDSLTINNPSSADHHFAQTFSDLLSNTDDRDLEEQCWERAIGFWQQRLNDKDTNDTNELVTYTRMLFDPPQSASLEGVSEQLKRSGPSIASSIADRQVLEFVAAEVEATTHPDILSNAIEILDTIINHNDSDRITAPDERWTIVKAAAEDGDDLALEVAQKLLELGEPEYKKIIDQYKRKI